MNSVEYFVATAAIADASFVVVGVVVLVAKRKLSKLRGCKACRF